MKEIFNEDFVKFLLGFFAIVLLALGVIFTAEQVIETDSDSGTSDTIQMLPATTTSGQ